MSYGENNPQGLVPKSTLSGAQSIQNLASKIGITARIKSGYPQSIGIGDPVVLWTGTGRTGYIQSAYDYKNTAATPLNSVSGLNIYGTFAGCKIPSQNNNPNATFPSTPGLNPAWIAGTTTSGGVDTEVYVIPSTYQILYSIQVGATGAALTALGRYGKFVFQVNGGGIVQLSSSGQSTGYLDVSTGDGYAYNPVTPYNAAANPSGMCSFQIVGFDDSFSLGNTTTARSQIRLPRGNVLVRIGATPFNTFTSVES
jgi:hypothetical protein